MGIIRKVFWIWLFALAFSLFNCTREEFDCECPEPKTEFLQFANETESYNFIRKETGLYERVNNDTVISSKEDYSGYKIEYSTLKIAQNTKSRESKFSVFSSAYACDCVGNNFLFKSPYPVAIRVYNIHTVNDSIQAETLYNKYTAITNADENGAKNFKMKANNINIDVDALINGEEQIYSQEFGVNFYFSPDLIQSDSVQFRIETELNTGEVLVTKTPLVRFEN